MKIGKLYAFLSVANKGANGDHILCKINFGKLERILAPGVINCPLGANCLENGGHGAVCYEPGRVEQCLKPTKCWKQSLVGYLRYAKPMT